MSIFKELSLLFIATVICTSCVEDKSSTNYETIPLPQEIKKKDGNAFIISATTKILYTSGNNLLKNNAQFLAEYIRFATGIKLKVSAGDSATNAIILSAKLTSVNKEAYQIKVAEDGILIKGASEAGNFYGIQTLRKSLTETLLDSTVAMSPVEINDQPRFAYRGMMLDVSRHFMTVEEVKSFIDMEALHNQNTLHWHLTDDQGWRIEIKKYPLLTVIGSKRSETVIGHNSGLYDGIPQEGYYTQAQIREVVEYAQKRYITIIPEIDMPGHMMAALASYPQLGCTGGPYEVLKTWGVADEVLCAGKESTFEFVEGVLAEVIELFPSKMIHIGGDECPKVRWAACKACQARIKAEGLIADSIHSAENRLQSYFITRVEKFVNSKGRSIIGWDEILEGGLPPNATVMAWTGIANGIKAAQEKHDVIMTPNEYTYFDHYQSNDTKSEPDAIGGYLPIDSVYAYEPVPDGLTPEEQKHIIGVQANLWTEYMPDFKQVQYMTLPRIAAMSEVQWTQPEKKNFKQFITRLPQLMDIYDALGYNSAKHLYEVRAELVPNREHGNIEVTLKSLLEGNIYYTLDGTVPTRYCAKYDGPFTVSGYADLCAVVIRSSGTSRVFKEKIRLNIASLKPVTLLQKPIGGYPKDIAQLLNDGLKGESSYNSNRWIGFQSSDLEAVFDLRGETEIYKVQISADVKKDDWILGPSSLAAFSSSDGTNFKEIMMKKIPVLAKQDSDKIYNYELTFYPVKTNYVKVMVKRTPVLPPWHPCKGAPAFLFVDEIEIF